MFFFRPFRHSADGFVVGDVFRLFPPLRGWPFTSGENFSRFHPSADGLAVDVLFRPFSGTRRMALSSVTCSACFRLSADGLLRLGENFFPFPPVQRQ
jgi:hypothetical protein